MTAKNRLLRALRGQRVDRVPLYMQIPFALAPDGSFRPGAFHGYTDYDDWRERDPAYGRLVRRMEAEADNFFIWRPPCMQSDQFFVPVTLLRGEPERKEGGMILSTQSLRVGARTLRCVRGCRPGTGHTWVLEHFCKEPDDAWALLDVPWEGAAATMDDFAELESRLGDRGLMWVTIPSPVLVVCRLFDPTEFLTLPLTEPELLHRLLETVAARIHANLTILLDGGAGPIIRFGGAEHCTPPLMSPALFDELVVRYDAPLMQLAKSRGRFVAVHCHGRIRHALRRFLEMGVDQTDPVEQVPDGDVTLADARRITESRMTLTGNVQVRELTSLSPAVIRARVRAIIAEAGAERLIVTTTGTPLEFIPPAVEANYNAMLDEVAGSQP